MSRGVCNNVKRAAVAALAAAAVALVPLPRDVVERAYSARVYPLLQHGVTSLSNAVPFALFDVLLAAVAAAWTTLVIRDWRRTRMAAALGAAAIRSVTWAAVAYLAFVLLWGLNYRRSPLVDRLEFDRASVNGDAARRLATTAVAQLNALGAPAHASGWMAIGTIDPTLADSVRRTAGDLGARPPIVGRPKRTLLDPYFRRAGVEGMTDPFFLETLVVSDLLPFERPLVIAHEWSHLAGLTDEGEANFAGWLACVRGSPADQYSGWLFLYQELAAVLTRPDRQALAAALGPTPRADLDASYARLRRNLEPRLSAVAWQAYDSYLKSNRVSAGARSYDQVVQLALGVRFDAGWTPRRR